VSNNYHLSATWNWIYSHSVSLFCRSSSIWCSCCLDRISAVQIVSFLCSIMVVSKFLLCNEWGAYVWGLLFCFLEVSFNSCLAGPFENDVKSHMCLTFLNNDSVVQQPFGMSKVAQIVVSSLFLHCWNGLGLWFSSCK